MQQSERDLPSVQDEDCKVQGRTFAGLPVLLGSAFGQEAESLQVSCRSHLNDFDSDLKRFRGCQTRQISSDRSLAASNSQE